MGGGQTGIVARRGALLALAVGVIALIVVLSTGNSGTGAPVDAGRSRRDRCRSGQYVKDAGVDVGTVQSITAVNGGHDAKVVL